METQPTTPPGETGFIDEKELLRRIPIARRTAFNWQRSGKLPCVKIGRRKLFHWPSVCEALLRQQRGGEQ
ncbi:MAG: helix-turn-helix transcriptional regulator [Limisphaerales bacterium]